MRERSHVITFCLALKKEKTNAILLPQKNDNFGQETSKVPGTIIAIIQFSYLILPKTSPSLKLSTKSAERGKDDR